MTPLPINDESPQTVFADLGISAQQVADALGISKQAVYQWKTIPNRRRTQIEAHFGLEPGSLGRTDKRQGFRSDLAESTPVPSIRAEGLFWKDQSDTLVAIPAGKNPVTDAPEGHVVVFLG